MTDLGFTGSMDSGSAAVAFRPLESVASDRYFDAARLIRVNSDFVAREAVGFLTSGYSGYAGTHLAQDGSTALEANLDFIAQEVLLVILQAPTIRIQHLLLLMLKEIQMMHRIAETILKIYSNQLHMI